MTDDTFSDLARDIAESIVERAETAGFESTADDDDVTELANDIETWLRTHMQASA